jgi:superfamily II DNA or RNA helicase
VIASAVVSPVDLRDYQEAAIRRARIEMRAGRKRVVIVLPTGAGKTRLAAAVVYSALGKGQRVLWLAHRSELVDQAYRTLAGFGLPVGVLAATSEHQPDPSAPVQVASIQTLVARETVRPAADLLIWDEAHHASLAASTWASLLDAYPGVPLLGLTATPERGDGAGLAPLFDGLVIGASVAQLTKLGHLVPCEIIRPAKLLDSGQIAQDPVAAYREHGGGRQALLFARSVEEAQDYAARLTAAGTRAECVHASTPAGTRALALECYRAGAVRVLTCVYVFTEGTDLPMASVCVLARGAGSAGVYLQMVGRVLRPAPGKSSALLIDLRGVSHIHGCPDDDRMYSLDGRGISLAESRHCQVCSALLDGGYPCPSCGYQPTQADAAETVVTGDPLVKFARMRAQNADERHAALLRWVRAALEKGHKPASVRYKWRAVYDSDLDMRTLLLAVQEVRRG